MTGERPAALLEPRLQERVLRHTVVQTADVCPFVHILNALVPQTGEQLVSFFKFLDTQMPVEQVIAVPKITKDMIQSRLFDCDLRQPQMAEQLADGFLNRSSTFQFRVVVGVRAVEVFLVSPSQSSTSFRRVEDDGGPCRGLQGFPQHRVQRRLAELKAEVFEVFTQDRVFSRRTHELIAVTPAPGGDPQDFSQLRVPRPVGGPQTLSPDKVQQSLSEQMMTTSLSVAPTSSWSTLAASTCFPLMRKRRMRRRMRRTSPCDSKAISGRGAFACTSSRSNAGGARRARSRARTTSSTRTCRDSGDG